MSTLDDLPVTDTSADAIGSNTATLPMFPGKTNAVQAVPDIDDYEAYRNSRRKKKIVKQSGPPGPLAYALAFVGFGLVLTAVYSPLLQYQFGFNDDYFALFERMRDADWMQAMQTQFCLQARPLEGLFYFPQVAFVDQIKDLVYVRGLGIFYLTVLATCFYSAFSSVRWTRWQAFAGAICLTVVPAFQVLLSWGTALQFVVPGIFAFFSFLFLQRNSETLLSKIINCGLSFLFMTVAITIYQPSAMLFWVFLAIGLSDLEKPENERWQLLISACSIAFSAVIVDFAAFEWAKHTFGTVSLLPGRTHLSLDPIGKVKWFFRNPLVDSLNFFRLQSSVTYAVRAGIFLAVGMVLYVRGNLRTLAGSCGVALALIPLAYLPNLLVGESISFYRTQVALMCLLTFYALLALQGVLKTFSCRGRSFTLIAMSVATLTGLIAYSHVLNFFAVPQSLELSVLRDQLSGKFGQKLVDKPMLFTREQTLAPYVCYDEFGMPSSAQEFDRIPLQVLLKLEALNALPPGALLTPRHHAAPADATEGAESKTSKGSKDLKGAKNSAKESKSSAASSKNSNMSANSSKDAKDSKNANDSKSAIDSLKRSQATSDTKEAIGYKNAHNSQSARSVKNETVDPDSQARPAARKGSLSSAPAMPAPASAVTPVDNSAPVPGQ